MFGRMDEGHIVSGIAELTGERKLKLNNKKKKKSLHKWNAEKTRYACWLITCIRYLR